MLSITPPILGIIAGQGSLPFLIADNYVKQGGLCYIAAIEGEANLELIQKFKNKTFKMGMVGAVIEYFQSHMVQNLIFIGGVNRPNFKNLAVDKIGGKLLIRIIKQKIIGDDKVLKIIANFFAEYGFQVIASNEIYKNQNSNTDIITIMPPTSFNIIDIELGMKLLKNLSEFDVGQSVIIDDGYVLGIEAAEGTDGLIARCAALRKKSIGGILIKAMKLNQDTRLDTPTIGPNTILNLAKYHYKGIAIEKDKVIVINEELTIKLANEYKIFIIRK